MSELNAARERLRERQTILTTATAMLGAETLNALKVVARHDLAEHPADDDDPVTEEWIKSLGIEYRPIYRGEEFIGDVVYEYGASPGDFCCIPLIKRTRGDVRRLLSALGIEGEN